MIDLTWPTICSIVQNFRKNWVKFGSYSNLFRSELGVGRSRPYEKNYISSSFPFPSQGSRGKASAFEISDPFLYRMSYWYGARINAHLWTLATSSVGTDLVGPNKNVNGRWSVTSVNLRAYKNLWNFFTANTKAKLTFSI